MSKFDELELQKKAHKYIPGGAHTYSRGDDQFPTNAPKALVSGKGCRSLGTNGVEYIDYGMGLRSVGIGYAEPSISNAAAEGGSLGNCLTRASVLEIEAAEAFCEHIPHVEMVKFAKHGSVATSAAIKLARASTGRDLILRCAQHPFFSFDDWFIGDTAMNRGVSQNTKDQTLNFNFNDAEALKAKLEEFGDRVAAVILEPCTHIQPTDSVFVKDGNFLHDVRHLCDEYGSLMILDEIITGFRWHLQGAATKYNVVPDLTTFGKAMANGFSVAALGGKRKYMELGGLDHNSERVFLTSTTHGAEMNGLAAFKATLDFYNNNEVIEHLWGFGGQLVEQANALVNSHGLTDNIEFIGPNCSPSYMTKDAEGQMSFEFRTLLNQEMIRNGILFSWLAPCFRHTDVELKQTVEALDKACGVYKKALGDGIEKHLDGPSIKPVFRKFN